MLAISSATGAGLDELVRTIFAALRGPSDWSEGERELFAAFVSALNQCPF